ncbi:class F sortase [Enterococcus raffinosus]|uniref:Class F sortase n=1 Tax=Enterococcus raffinosus TaxID=71452 RepID=A0AAW8T6G3_9ENTE|nr:class F sortase [Enterococcus raffinosus]MDT2522656.1 class F sortase [Enterococcus raffinosus]MDT2529956.1 class F sortase [Enterococcus raffinosus]MDT2532980.1 class F sortase [Enterococcus raffinosus]MDT2543837.1 class F sortase [Enterococcus raffinosus]MDT2555026.1 class F sortase [Enterococcus raffinosus]
MSTYLKFIVIAALFITTGAASVLEDSSASSPSTTDQTSVKQSSAKEEKNYNVSNEKVVEPHTESSTSLSPSTNSTSTSSEEASAPSSNEGQEAASSAAENTTTSSKEAAEASNRPAPTVNEAEPTNETTATEESQNTATPAPATIGADQLMINGQAISYSNAGQGSGQAIIDANPNQVATWGGAVVQSGNDGANTHFIGHNPGIFNVLFSLGTGATIEVSDSANNVTTYTVSQIVTVDDSGFAADGTDYWDQITGSGGGERITLQTCINDDYNLIVFANK